MEDVSFSLLDFGFPKVRNYFETSHAKCSQGGDSANLKHKADIAVIRREVVIQNAYSILQKPTLFTISTQFQSQVVKLKRRVFFYESKHNRDRPYRMFKEVKNNCSILANSH